MSIEQAKVCIETMKRDAHFRERVLAIDELAERIKFINNAGFACTIKEMQDVFCELNDDELDNAAGGISMYVSGEWDTWSLC